MSDLATTSQHEYMALAEGVAIIPEKYRNAAYGKLEFGPGEGGLGNSVSQGRTDTGMDAFLAAIAAGADPQEYAKQMLASKPTSRAPRGRKEVAA